MAFWTSSCQRDFSGAPLFWSAKNRSIVDAKVVYVELNHLGGLNQLVGIEEELRDALPCAKEFMVTVVLIDELDRRPCRFHTGSRAFRDNER